MKYLSTLLCCFIFLVGCQQTTQQVKTPRGNHTASDLMFVKQGMSIDEVMFRLGNPTEIGTSAVSGDDRKVFIYSGHMFLVDDGKVASDVSFVGPSDPSQPFIILPQEGAMFKIN